MSEKQSLKWHEIINERKDDALTFLDLYREFAEAVKEREAKKRAAAYWPFPKE